MNNSGLNLHEITKIEIEENDGAEGAVWRHIVFTCKDGSTFTITAFPPRPNTDGVPVSFVRNLD